MAVLNTSTKKKEQGEGRLGGAAFTPIHRDEAEQLRMTGGQTVRAGGAGSGVGSYDGQGGINPLAIRNRTQAAVKPGDTPAGGSGGGTTTDPNAAQANALYQQLMNRGPFQYDLQGDMLYRQYADQYSALGQQAMRDTMGTAAGLTGGYGNSWAGTVGNQAYQQYLGQLNGMIPEFYDRAYQRWQDQGDQLLQQYQLALDRAAASGGGGGGTGRTEDETSARLKAAYAGAPTAQQSDVAEAMQAAVHQAEQNKLVAAWDPAPKVDLNFDYYTAYRNLLNKMKEK